jgi:hypothetical protein
LNKPAKIISITDHYQYILHYEGRYKGLFLQCAHISCLFVFALFKVDNTAISPLPQIAKIEALPKSVIPKCQVVHTALGACTCLKGCQNYISYPLRSKNIPPHNSSLVAWGEERTFWNFDPYWCKASLVQGYVHVHHAPSSIQELKRKVNISIQDLIARTLQILPNCVN